MIPAGPHPLMMCGDGDPLDEWYKIANAVRLNAPDGAHFTWTNGVPTDQTRWTSVFWIKRALLAANQCVLSGKSGTTTAEIAFYSSDLFTYRGLVDGVGSSQGALDSVRLFRDLGGWTPFLVNYDASRPAATRIRAFCEDGEVAFSVLTNIGTCNMNTAGATMRLGRTQYNANTYYAGLNIADFRFIDGQVLYPESFWRRHPRTGQCRPIPYTGTYGNNGRHYDFSDGSAATAAALGKDRSGNNNDATPVNISVAAGTGCDWLEDTPTKNACVMNGLDKNPAFTLSNGGLSFTTTNNRFMRATMPLSRGKWWYEFFPAAGGANTSGFGFIGPNIDVMGSAAFSSALTGMVGYANNGNKWINGVATAYGASYGAAAVMRAEINLDASPPTVEFFKDTVSQGVINLPAGLTWLPAVDYSEAGTHHVNFGQQPPTHLPTSGFKAICTKNLPIYPAGPMKSSNAFVAVTDSGANIVSALAAAAPWSDWIRIIKRRDPTAEGWRWIFSDDPANYLDTSTTNEKAALPAFAGSSYVGYALKVSAANGVATGTFEHATGVASVISDGLSNARKMVILHRESVGGGAFYVYHPDCAAGKLLYLNASAVETTDASINSVTASGFTADALLPSGTYRWVSLAEVDGFLKLGGKYAGTSSTNGPCLSGGQTPQLSFVKSTNDPAGDWLAMDRARSTGNPANKYLMMNTSGPEGTAALMDLLSNGTKLVLSDGDTNLSVNKYVWASIAAFHFRYANAQ